MYKLTFRKSGTSQKLFNFDIETKKRSYTRLYICIYIIFMHCVYISHFNTDSITTKDDT